MEPALFVVVLIALIPHLILAGGGIDRLLVQLPGRHRVGLIGYARWAPATDLGNGLIFYPVLGISGPLFTFVALAVALIEGAPGRIVMLLAVACVLCVLHSLTTIVAAPTMMRIGRAGDDENQLRPLVDRFVAASVPRAILQACDRSRAHVGIDRQVTLVRNPVRGRAPMRRTRPPTRR